MRQGGDFVNKIRLFSLLMVLIMALSMTGIYASAADNPYTIEDATEAFVYAVQGIFADVIEYQPKAMASVSGTVKDADGNPVKDADVALLNYDNAEETIVQTTTDTNGKYLFNNVPDDFYVLRITCGKMTAESIVTVFSSNLIPLNSTYAWLPLELACTNLLTASSKIVPSST